METRVYKSIRGDWTAETETPMPDIGSNRVLMVYTSKVYTGALVTRATVHTVNDGMRSYALFSDYSECIETDPKARCTEKAIRNQHSIALARIEEIKTRARTFYAKSATQDNPDVRIVHL